jgi:hypothetical protein
MDHDSYSKDSSANENGKNIKKVKMHLKMTLSLKMQMQMEMLLLRNRSIILTLKIQMVMKMKKKIMVVKIHPKMTLPLKKTNRILFRENSRIMTNCTSFLPLKN